MKHKHDQQGSHIIAVALMLVVVVVIGAVGWRVVSKSRSDNSSTASQSQNTTTSTNDTASQACDTTPVVSLPVEKALIESILYPGQSRGGNYKPHGGFRLNTVDNTASITLPLDARVIAGARYIEQGEVQYMFDFETYCKIRLRFDHLLVLGEALQSVAASLPEPKPDDSRTTNLNGPALKAGTVLATEVGFAKNHNVGFDFGMYDYNQKNKKSQDSTWLADPQHQFDMAQYAVCWFDYLSPADKEHVLSLPAGDQQNGSNSDYCN